MADDILRDKMQLDLCRYALAVPSNRHLYREKTFLRNHMYIRYFRQRAGLKQNELSDIIDMSPQHISHIESGEPLSLNTLVQIANALGVDANCLLGHNLLKIKPDDLQEALIRRTQNFSKEDLNRLLQVCDIFFP